ncbi:MAG: alpha/beta hydrolase [Planctomycetota bacterium]
MKTHHFRFIQFVALCCFLLSSAGVAAQAQDDASAGVEKTVKTKDGWTIHFTYWESTMGKDAPVVILLHGDKTTRLQWKASGLPAQLAKEQYAVIAVDLRKHGDSQPPEDAPARVKSSTLSKFDYEGMVAADLEAIKKFLYEEHQAQRLNMRKLGIVATEFSTPIAVAFAAFDWAKKPYDDAPTLKAKTPRGQDVQALALISPQDSVTGVATTQPLRLLRNTGIAALLLTGETSSRRSRTIDRMFKGFGGDQQGAGNQRVYRQSFEKVKLSGVDLLTKYRPQGRPVAMIAVLGFLKKHVFDQKIDWKNRQSRLQ